MPSIRVYADKRTYKSMGHRRREVLGQRLRRICCRVLNVPELGNQVPVRDVEVIWFDVLEHINMAPLTIDLMFSVGQDGIEIPPNKVEEISEEFDKELQRTRLPRSRDRNAGCWTIAFGGEKVKTRFKIAKTRRARPFRNAA